MPRKPLDPDGKPSVVITARVPPATADQIDRLRGGMTRSAWVASATTASVVTPEQAQAIRDAHYALDACYRGKGALLI